MYHLYTPLIFGTIANTYVLTSVACSVSPIAQGK